MKLELHHINLSTRNVKELEVFYKDILFLDTQTEDLPVLEKKKGYSGEVSFVGDGKVQMHLAQKIYLLISKQVILLIRLKKAILLIVLMISKPLKTILKQRKSTLRTGAT